MDDGSLVFLGFLAIIGLLLGPIGFFMTLGARARLKRVEAQLAALTGRAPAYQPGRDDRPPLLRLQPEEPFAPPTQPSLDGAVETIEQAQFAPAAADPPQVFVEEDSVEEDSPQEAPPFTPAPPPPAEKIVPLPAPARRKIGLEERLGAHWAVIVGGVALAFGALLLVKYSIEQGFFGPGLRIVCGLLLGVGLVAAGEYLRRKEPPASGENPRAPIPAVLTGAGTVAAFGSLYAAHALYGFIGPGPAFILMGAVGVATMFAAALHGPALAGLGLIGALVAPLLVTSSDPNPWPVVLYVAVVSAAAYGLARLRRWLWLAIAAAAGAALWEGLFLLNLHGINSIDFTLASLAHLVIETALLIVAFAFAPHWRVPPAEQRTDTIASEAMLGCAAVACADVLRRLGRRRDRHGLDTRGLASRRHARVIRRVAARRRERQRRRGRRHSRQHWRAGAQARVWSPTPTPSSKRGRRFGETRASSSASA